MIKNVLVLVLVGFSLAAFAQQSHQYTITQETTDAYNVVLELNNEAIVFQPRDVSVVSGTIKFKDTYSNSSETAELITEEFTIDLRGKEAPLAISEGEFIWVEATLVNKRPSVNDTDDYRPWEEQDNKYQSEPWETYPQSSDQLHIKITSSNEIVLAKITIAAKQN